MYYLKIKSGFNIPDVKFQGIQCLQKHSLRGLIDRGLHYNECFVSKGSFFFHIYNNKQVVKPPSCQDKMLACSITVNHSYVHIKATDHIDIALH